MESYKEYLNSALLAKCAYSNQEQLKMHDSTDILNGVEPEFYSDSETGAYAFSILKEKTLCFVFRGTNDIKDAIVDLDVLRVPFFEGKKLSNIRVHGGFMRQFTALKESVLEKIFLYSNRNKINTIQFVGHSLGGALATLFAGYISKSFNTEKIKIICHTFGSPRVGNKAYATWFQENGCSVARITNMKDPVSQMPISAYYQHVSDAICFNDDLSIKVVPDKQWYWRLMNFKMNVCKPVLEHSCDLYIERLMKLCTSEAEAKAKAEAKAEVEAKAKITILIE